MKSIFEPFGIEFVQWAVLTSDIIHYNWIKLTL